MKRVLERVACLPDPRGLPHAHLHIVSSASQVKRGVVLFFFFGGYDGGLRLSRRGTAYRRNTCRERGQVFPLLGHAC